MRKITDLTLPVVEHWRYGIKFELATSHANKDSNEREGEYPHSVCAAEGCII